jgi:hypothetical protein
MTRKQELLVDPEYRNTRRTLLLRSTALAYRRPGVFHMRRFLTYVARTHYHVTTLYWGCMIDFNTGDVVAFARNAMYPH